MRNSPWFLLSLAASTVALAGVALLRPSVEQLDGSRQSPWDLLLEWRHQGHVPAEAAARVVAPLRERNGILQGLHIQLRVEDENGQSIQGATIVCDRFLPNSSGRVDSGLTNLNGDFASTRLVKGDYEVQVDMPGYLPSGPQYWNLPADGGAAKTIRLTSASTLQGSLMGLDGIPQNQGILMLTAQDRELQIQIEVDKDGHFSSTQIPVGKWTLSWRSHAAADQNAALTHTLDFQVDEIAKVGIILPAEMLLPPSEFPARGVGIYLVEAN